MVFLDNEVGLAWQDLNIPVLQMNGDRRHHWNGLPIHLRHGSGPHQRRWISVPAPEWVPAQHSEHLLGLVPVHRRRSGQNLKILTPRVRQLSLHKPLNDASVELSQPLIQHHLPLSEQSSLSLHPPLGREHFRGLGVGVNLIQHDCPQSRVHMADDRCAFVQVAAQLVGRANDNIGLHNRLLGRDVADNEGRGVALALGEEAHAVDLREDLHGQLAGGGHDDDLVAVLAPLGLLGHRGQQRQHHGQGLAGACLALQAHALAAVHTVEDRLLDRRCRRYSSALQLLDDPGGQREVLSQRGQLILVPGEVGETLHIVHLEDARLLHNPGGPRVHLLHTRVGEVQPPSAIQKPSKALLLAQLGSNDITRH
mmetsp:Transcript_41301/g.118038  ORF Transcript_41301/g.118038 Transcript_41301/m.118038 type:complete len:367 (+) Transcript_41301:1154-2254(+)